MSALLKVALVLLAVSGTATSGYVFYNAALSSNDWVYRGGSPPIGPMEVFTALRGPLQVPVFRSRPQHMVFIG